MRMLPASGINLFQLIYILIRDYESQSGKKALNLSLGNPDLLPDIEILKLKAQFAGRAEYALHTYAEDNNINQFCEGAAWHFAGIDLSVALKEQPKRISALPIAGIKSATAVLPLSCGLHLKRSKNEPFTVITQKPAYDTLGHWSEQYFGVNKLVWPLQVESGMKLDVNALKKVVKAATQSHPTQSIDLIHVVRPGNPAAQGATQEEWQELIEFCIQIGARLSNDAAYATLTPIRFSRQSDNLRPAQFAASVSLAQVAIGYPKLEWCELYSVSKAFSDPGARLGFMLGSPDWIEDFKIIKGNTDSGPNPHIMAAYGELFKNEALTSQIMDQTFQIYSKRLAYLTHAFKTAGFEPACDTTAGFFTLWRVPKKAFGISIADEASKRQCSHSEAFNRLMIDQTGIVGVHFEADQPLIRYAACADVLAPDFQARFEAELKKI